LFAAKKERVLAEGPANSIEFNPEMEARGQRDASDLREELGYSHTRISATRRSLKENENL